MSVGCAPLATHGDGAPVLRKRPLWYREKYRPAAYSYSHFITLTTCYCITHVDFLTPNINWDLVQF